MRAARPRRGGAAVEFALVLPTILLVLIGMVTVANYLTSRYHLTSAATHGARACSLNSVGNRPACVTAAVGAHLPQWVRDRCAALQINPSENALPGTPVTLLRVDLGCTYNPIVGGQFLAAAGIGLPALQVQGTMPLQQ